MDPRELRKAAKNLGYTLVKEGTKHDIYEHPETGETIALSRGTKMNQVSARKQLAEMFSKAQAEEPDQPKTKPKPNGTDQSAEQPAPSSSPPPDDQEALKRAASWQTADELYHLLSPTVTQRHLHTLAAKGQPTHEGWQPIRAHVTKQDREEDPERWYRRSYKYRAVPTESPEAQAYRESLKQLQHQDVQQRAAQWQTAAELADLLGVTESNISLAATDGSVVDQTWLVVRETLDDETRQSSPDRWYGRRTKFRAVLTAEVEDDATSSSTASTSTAVTDERGGDRVTELEEQLLAEMERADQAHRQLKAAKEVLDLVDRMCMGDERVDVAELQAAMYRYVRAGHGVE